MNKYDMNDNEQLEKNEIESTRWDGLSTPPQSLLNNWYSHTSNKERTIANCERYYEESTNPFD